MSKPWDNEETPMTDAASESWNTTGDEYHDAVHSADVRNIERRMRAAERLLHWISEKPVSDIGAILKQTKIHLEAARKEDVQ